MTFFLLFLHCHQLLKFFVDLRLEPLRGGRR
jgi:hypothetical protein